MNKGFTLIELLGVLILLAIISLIAAPVVLNLISDSKEQAKTKSLEQYVRAVKLAIANYNTNGNLSDAICTIQSDGGLNCNGVILDVDVNNTRPTNGVIVVKDYDISDYYAIEIGESHFSSVEFKGTKVEPTTNDTHKGIVYLDPTDLSATCNATLASQNLNDAETPTPTGVNSGCMKFYIYNDEGFNYKMILDHNIVPRATWIRKSQFTAAGGTDAEWSTNKSKYGPLNIFAVLDESAGDWVGNPRALTGNELAHIIGTDEALGWDSSKIFKNNPSDLTDTDTQIGGYYLDGSGDTYSDWNVQISNSTNKSPYAWLYDYLDNCIQYGCNYEDNNSYSYSTLANSTVIGYWLYDYTVGQPLYAMLVHQSGRLMATSLGNTALSIRPVIELPKALIDG